MLKKKKEYLKMTLICLCLSMSLMGCTIGIKQKTVVVYSSMSKPIGYKGLIRISTNDKVDVTVDNKPAKLDLGGYFVIHKADLKKLLDIAKGVK